ncbi:MAG: DNA cytosine methyltransferase [Gallionella sp.]|jgi:DNA (cytosine-5)-methyltransferase 1
MDHSSLTCPQLVALCKEGNIKGYSGKKKAELLEMLGSTPPLNSVVGASSSSSSGVTVPLVDVPADAITFIEVCAGAGGLSSGLMKAGLTPVLLNEIDKDCCNTLRKNHPGVPVKCCSMLDLNLDAWIGKLSLLIGGVPCQAYSQAGNRRGFDDPRGNLILEFAKLVHKLRPRMFMIENVKGLLSHDKGQTLAEVISRLSADDLYTIEYKVLNASFFNVAQKRERVFIVGVLKSENKTFHYPEPEAEVKVLRDVLTDVPVSAGASYPESKIELFSLIPQGGCWVNLPPDLQKAYLGKSFESGGGKRGILHRGSLDKPSLTILCSPSQKQTERCHPTENRPYTTRESARIQSFPDDYEFTGSMSSQYKQIGNSVPVELARRMGMSIMDCLRG